MKKNDSREIPKEVRGAAKDLIKEFGDHLKYKNRKDGYDVYIFDCPELDDEVSDRGAWCCLFDGSEAVVLSGFEAVGMCSYYIENI